MVEEELAEAAALYGRGDFPGAIAAWTRAIDQLQLPPSPGEAGAAEEGPAAADSALRLRARCLANRAQAWLQLREHAAAEQDCAACLRLDPGNAKVALRRATALLALERVTEAQSQLERAMALDLPPTLVRSLNGLREQARAMAQMLHGPGGVDADAKEAIGLVDEAQTLRLSFRDGPPPALPWGAWSTISLFLSNEFGLWRRADFPVRDPSRETLPLEFGVYDHGGGYCAASTAVGVEVQGAAEGEEEEKGEGTGTDAVVLRRHTSCRVRCRVRFVSLKEQEGHADDPAAADSAPSSPSVVHLRVGLPPALLTREVLPVVSLPIRLVVPSAPSRREAGGASDNAPDEHGPQAEGEGEGEDAGVDARLGIKGCRTILLPALGRALLCAESPGQAGIAGKVWDAGLVLTQYLAAHPEVIAAPKRCLELGAGTGAAGIAAALLGASVVITDLEWVVSLIQRNIDLNLPPSSSSSPSAAMAVAAAYAWGESKAALGGDEAVFDAILMADVVYDPKYYSALVQALRDVSHPGTVVTLAHRERHPDAALFFEEARRYFAVDEISFSPPPEPEPEPEPESEPEATGTAGAPRRACADVHIFEMRLLP